MQTIHIKLISMAIPLTIASSSTKCTSQIKLDDEDYSRIHCFLNAFSNVMDEQNLNVQQWQPIFNVKCKRIISMRNVSTHRVPAKHDWNIDKFMCSSISLRCESLHCRLEYWMISNFALKYVAVLHIFLYTIDHQK